MSHIFYDDTLFQTKSNSPDSSPTVWLFFIQMMVGVGVPVTSQVIVMESLTFTLWSVRMLVILADSKAKYTNSLGHQHNPVLEVDGFGKFKQIELLFWLAQGVMLQQEGGTILGKLITAIFNSLFIVMTLYVENKPHLGAFPKIYFNCQPFVCLFEGEQKFIFFTWEKTYFAIIWISFFV